MARVGCMCRLPCQICLNSDRQIRSSVEPPLYKIQQLRQTNERMKHAEQVIITKAERLPLRVSSVIRACEGYLGRETSYPLSWKAHTHTYKHK